MATYNVLLSNRTGPLIYVRITGGDGVFKHLNVDESSYQGGEVSQSQSQTANIHLTTPSFNNFASAVANLPATVQFTPDSDGSIDWFSWQ